MSSLMTMYLARWMLLGMESRRIEKADLFHSPIDTLRLSNAGLIDIPAFPSNLIFAPHLCGWSALSTALSIFSVCKTTLNSHRHPRIMSKRFCPERSFFALALFHSQEVISLVVSLLHASVLMTPALELRDTLRTGGGSGPPYSRH